MPRVGFLMFDNFAEGQAGIFRDVWHWMTL